MAMRARSSSVRTLTGADTPLPHSHCEDHFTYARLLPQSCARGYVPRATKPTQSQLISSTVVFRLTTILWDRRSDERNRGKVHGGALGLKFQASFASPSKEIFAVPEVKRGELIVINDCETARLNLCVLLRTGLR